MIETIVRVESVLFLSLWLIWILRIIDICRTKSGYARGIEIITGNIIVASINVTFLAFNMIAYVIIKGT